MESIRIIDLTSEQFGDEVLDYTNNPEQFREVHFAKEEKRQRQARMSDERTMILILIMIAYPVYNSCKLLDSYQIFF